MKSELINPYTGINDFSPRAATDVQRGIPNDGWADIVLGQPNFNQITPNEVVDNKLFNPGGILVDRSTQPNRVYVYDAGNSRVLGMTHLGQCTAGENIGQPCTSRSDCPGSSCQIQEDKPADIVLGQPSFTSSACNGDSGLQDYPNFPAASENTLCGMFSSAVSTLESGTIATMDVDPDGNLYVPDIFNHRVLRYNTPFESDTVADHVWGQSDFTGTACNDNQTQPDNKTLCLAPPPFIGDLKSGLALDTANNLWIADTQNNRVLRFPYDVNTGTAAKEADLVLGQPNFASKVPGDTLSRMNRPSSIRVGTDDTVYVADGIAGGPEGRVLIFEPPFSNGMAATTTIGTGLKEVTGLELGPNGGLWINDPENQRILHYLDGVLQNTITPTLSRSWSSLGVDRDNNVMVTGWGPQQISVYSSLDYTQSSVFFKADEYGSFNQIGSRGFHEGLGLELAEGQLIYADGSRMLFWNDPQNLSNFQAADGVVGEPDFTSWRRWGPSFYRMRADNQENLWVINGNNASARVLAYELPLETGEEPSITINPPLPLLGGGEFDWTPGLVLGGIDIQPGCDCLWLSDNDNHRVFRINNVSSEQRVVDIVLGQTDESGNHCNHGRDSDSGYIQPVFPSQDSLCHPGALTFDNDGNLFVSDHNLELAGNRRLLVFSADTLPESLASAAFGIPASYVLGRNNDFTESNCLPTDPMCGSWEPAFNSQGQMLIGFNGYFGPRFIQSYQDPLENPLPQTALKDFVSQPVSTRFDELDNLYSLDLTRHRILIYLTANVVAPGVNGGDGPGGVGATNGETSLNLWLNANNIAGTSDDPVATWGDDSGNNINFGQGTGDAQPAIEIPLNSNGQKTVRFDGINDVLSGGDRLDFQRTDPHSMFLVVQDASTSGASFLFSKKNDSAPYTGWDYFLRDRETPRLWTAFVNTWDTNAIAIQYNSVVFDSTNFHIEDFTYDGSSTVSGYSLWRDGALEPPTTRENSLTADTTNAMNVQIGNRDGGGSETAFDGDVSEVIVYNTELNDIQRILVENYLSSKYEIAIPEANDHYDGDTLDKGDFDLDVAGIGQENTSGNRHRQAHAAGIIVKDRNFLQDNGDWLLFGHRTINNNNLPSGLPTGGDWGSAPDPKRWSRHFYIDVTDAAGTDCTTPGTCFVDIIFDYSDGGMSNGKLPAGDVSNYRLLKRGDEETQFSDIATATVIVDDQVQFLNVDVNLLGSNFTLGTLDANDSPTAVTLNSFTPYNQSLNLFTVLVVGVLGLGSLWLRRRTER